MTALMSLDARLRLARLHLVTDTRGGGRAFGDFCVEAFSNGVDMLQVREQGLSDAQLTEALEIARSVALQLNKLVVVSENLAVATAFGADVIQLDALASPSVAKASQHEYALVGAATHDIVGLDAALADAAVSYVTVGPVYGGSHPRHRLPGLEFVRAAAERAPVADAAGTPWFAIGGIDASTLDDVLDAGARRVVVTRAALGGGNVGEAVSGLADRLRTAWSADDSLDSYALSVFGNPSGLLKP